MELMDWIKKYEKKAERFAVPNGFALFFEPDKGFFLYKVQGDVFHIDATCTNDFHYMLRTVNAMAKARGCTLLVTQTHRDPVAYMRLSKAQINYHLSGIRSNGLFYYVFVKEVI